MASDADAASYDERFRLDMMVEAFLCRRRRVFSGYVCTCVCHCNNSTLDRVEAPVWHRTESIALHDEE